MNAKQSLRELRKYCDELEDFNRKSTATVRGLYSVIDALFTGKNVCESCIDFQECQLQAKEEGKGCELWWLKYPEKEDQRNEKDPISKAEKESQQACQ